MKGAGMLMLLLAFLLVAMPVAAVSTMDINGAVSASALQTKIIGGEEVGALVLAENVTVPSVGTEALVISMILVSAFLGLLVSRSRFRSNKYVSGIAALRRYNLRH
jgi:hypothetical protein